MTSVVHVFGIARGEDDTSPADGVRQVRDGALAALVEDVPATEWSADALPTMLEDLGWLSEQARRHDAVLRDHLPRPVVPCPLTTVFRDDEHVRAMLREQGDDLSAQLRRVDGCIELGVVVHVEGEDNQRRSEQATTERPASGSDYIAARLRRRDRADARRSRAAEIADEVHACLGVAAIDSVRGEPRPRALDDDSGRNVLNASYLVALAEVDRFDGEVRALAERLAPDGVRVRRTGPWAPFHFVGLEANR